ncbi:MgtC/SapB family protein [Fimbriiglobus ruber]|uniref:Protein MgtC n=1 Tax=Fimbriiglobus ruber TaxID=1908690 RepID=A0A225DG61_9BACT|nr:MgtC/SapB family protein [Fimbriiglobus ruber]OWK38634.1 Mg(2+) transport ATPase protein C [Fimbriiglobus ruber]
MPSLSFAVGIIAALLMGMAIGLERQWRQHPAGLRTNTLVALGAALFVSLSLLMNDTNSPTRIASYVVSGLGFLGGGVILRDGLNVKGLNTAASLWCSGAVGTLCGAGFAGHALFGTAAVLAVHFGLRPLARWMDTRTKMATDVETYYRLRVEAEASHDAHIRHILLRHIGGHAKLNLQGLSTEDTETNRVVVLADIFALERNDRAMEEIVARVSIEPEVKAVSWQRTEG